MGGERLQLEHHPRRELGLAHRVRAQTWARRGDVLPLGRSTPLGAFAEGLMGWAVSGSLRSGSLETIEFHLCLALRLLEALPF